MVIHPYLVPPETAICAPFLYTLRNYSLSHHCKAGSSSLLGAKFFELYSVGVGSFIVCVMLKTITRYLVIAAKVSHCLNLLFRLII